MMESVIAKIIGQLNTSVFVLITVLYGMGYVLVKIGEWKEKLFHHHNRIDNLEGLSEKVVVLATKIDLIYGYTNPNSMTRSHSPISLTENGLITSEAIGATAMLNKYYARLKRDTEADNPQNAYDIQTSAMRVSKEKLASYLDSAEINTIKDAAYNKGVLVEDILSIFGVMLRDKLLQERGIPIAEVDLHAPNQ